MADRAVNRGLSEETVFHRAYRYRLRSNRKAEAVLRRWVGCPLVHLACTIVWLA